MVNLVKEWMGFKRAAGRCQGAYQVNDVTEGVEVRVLAGRFGFIGRFGNKNNEQFKAIIQHCDSNDYVEIQGSIPDQFFFEAVKP